jgi:hypothetical protein
MEKNMGFTFDEEDDDLSLGTPKRPQPSTATPSEQPSADAPNAEPNPAPIPEPDVMQEEIKPSIPLAPVIKPSIQVTETISKLPRPGQQQGQNASTAPQGESLKSLLKDDIIPAEASNDSKADSTEPETLKKKPIIKKGRLPRESKKERSENPSPFAGGRKKVLQIRVAFFSVLAIVAISGLYSFFPKTSFSEDLTSRQVAISDSNKYDSIRTNMEAYTLRFVTDVMERSKATEPQFNDTLAYYMGENALYGRNMFSLSKINSASNEYKRQTPIYQSIISGPYVIDHGIIDPANIYTFRNRALSTLGAEFVADSYMMSVKVAVYVRYYVDPRDEADLDPELGFTKPELRNKWVYISVPIIHNFKTKETMVYGYPSFISPEITQNFGNKYKDILDGLPDWQILDELTSSNTALITTLENFFDQWAAENPNDGSNSDGQPIISNQLRLLLTPDATVQAKNGLGDTFIRDPDYRLKVSVEGFPKDAMADVNSSTTRKALVSITWTDNYADSSMFAEKSKYQQQYIVYFRGFGSDWKVYDIKPRFSEF